MAFNQATQARRELLVRVCRLILNGRLKEEIDRIPVEMRPKKGRPLRCCVHKDRAVLKYRLMTILGFNVTDEDDELTPLAEYAQRAMDRTDFTDVMLTVVDEACSSCVKGNYAVTNLCRACEGRPCTFACAKKAIRVGHQAEIDYSACVNCGRCMQACPFNAIIYQPVPCEESCPVGAISKNEDGIEQIDHEKCVYCGKCKEACPFGAIMEKTYLIQILREMMAGKKVVALVAPAIAGQFVSPLGNTLAAVRKAGFSQVVEVAKGANVTSANEAVEWEERIEGGAPFMTTSCCPSYTAWVDKHVPELRPFVSHTATPAAYTAEMVKAEDPDCITVFIGPCLAKRIEGYYHPKIDYVMSFEELGALMVAQGVDVQAVEPAALDTTIQDHGRLYACSGGVAGSLAPYMKQPDKVKSELISGLDKASMRVLKSYASGKCPYNFVEVMMCEGGCINGCNVVANPKVAARQVQGLKS